MELLADKYKPKRLNDILGNDQILETLKSYNESFPHLLFTGPPGCGKTTVAHIMKNEIFDITLELNASDDRGIDVIRNKIKGFCESHFTSSKLVILDECDNMTTAAQGALRRILETSNTKFILICNEISKVCEPIQSRCAILKFSGVSVAQFLGKIKSICNNENIRLSDSGYGALVDLSQGDFRSCLNCLESVRYLNSLMIDDEFLYSINGIPNIKIIEKLYKSIKLVNRSNFKDAEADLIHNQVENIFRMKFNVSEIVSRLFNIAKEDNNYKILRIISEYQSKFSDGLITKLQFYSMLYKIIK